MKKNGKIELLRFVFAVIVVIFHINIDTWRLELQTYGWFPLFAQGALGVEFFFLVSGYLMAKSVRKQNSIQAPDIDTLGSDTIQFLWRKLKPILPFHLLFCTMRLLLNIAYTPDVSFVYFAERIPSLLFLSHTGINSNTFLGVEWYIGAMLLCMLMLYPLCRYRYNLFVFVFAPAAGILLTGYMMHEFGRVAGTTHWAVFTFKCNLRAFAEICFGAVCYEASSALEKINFSKFSRFLLSLLELLSYSVVFVITCMLDQPESYQYQPLCLIMLMIGVTLSFAQTGILAKTVLFQNRFFVFLGGASLSIYLCQNIPRLYALWYLQELPELQRASLALVLTLALGIGAYVLWNGIVKLRNSIVKPRNR